MAVTTYDPGTGAVSATQDSSANALNTITIAAAGAGATIRISKITVDTSAAAAAADTSVVIKDDGGTVVWKRFLGATRGPQWTEEFYNVGPSSHPFGFQSRPNKQITVEVAAAGAGCVTTLNVLYDYRK